MIKREMNLFLMFSIVNLKRETHLAVCRCRVTCSTQMGRSMTSAHWSKWATASWWTMAMTASTSTSTSAGASVSPDQCLMDWFKRCIRVFLQICSVSECLSFLIFFCVHQTCQGNPAQKVLQPVWSSVRTPLTWDSPPSRWSCSPTTGVCMFLLK